MPFLPGHKTSPRGRSFISAALAKIAAKETKNGYEVLMYLLGVMRGDITELTYSSQGSDGKLLEVHSRPAIRDRTKAAELILDRLAGKPKESHEIEVSGPDGEPVKLLAATVLTALSDDDIRGLRSQLDRAIARATSAVDGGAGLALPGTQPAVLPPHADGQATGIPRDPEESER